MKDKDENPLPRVSFVPLVQASYISTLSRHYRNIQDRTESISFGVASNIDTSCYMIASPLEV